MKEEEHFRFSVEEFSPKRVAYALDYVIGGLLVWFANVGWENEGYLLDAAAAIAIIILVLGILTRPPERGRYVPFIIALALLFAFPLFAKA